MKKIFIPLLLALLGVCASACTQQISTPPKDATTLSAKIIDINGTSILVANMAEDAGAADIYWLDAATTAVISSDGDTINADALQTGMLVEIAYNGTILESFPMQFGSVSAIYIREQGDDIAGLYRQVINDLYVVDPGLNSDIEIMAFDFSAVSNITESEKTALIYSLGNAYSLETIQGTFDELAEQGYIDKENVYFPTGILFSIEVTSRDGDNSFTFNAKKWRSGLGAYFFNDCTANKTNTGWIYSVGSQAIS